MTRFRLDSLVCPVVQAPMAGGASTVALAAAVSNAGGLGFLAAGYKNVDAISAEVRELRAALPRGTPFGVNVFAPPGHGHGAAEVGRYADTLAGEAARAGVSLGDAVWDDDRYAEKIELLCNERVPVASFTFGVPSTLEVARLHSSGVAVWVTVTTVDEAAAARAAGVDALVVQGVEAGGHRGSFDDATPGDVGLLALLQLITLVADGLPLVAAGGVATGAGLAGALAAGAAAVAVGTAFMLSPEAGTARPQRDAMHDGTALSTVLTRAFTGRTARGIENRFTREHSDGAPSAYPEVHHLTSALRAAARAAGDADGFHLWAGQAYPLAQAEPAAGVVRRLVDEARSALAGATRRL